MYILQLYSFLWKSALYLGKPSRFNFLLQIYFWVYFRILSTNIWLAKMLEHSGNDNCSFTGLSILHLDEGIAACNNFNLPISPYRNFFLIALNIVLGQIVLIFLIDRIGRRICISIREVLIIAKSLNNLELCSGRMCHFWNV